MVTSTKKWIYYIQHLKNKGCKTALETAKQIALLREWSGKELQNSTIFTTIEELNTIFGIKYTRIEYLALVMELWVNYEANLVIMSKEDLDALDEKVIE